MPDQKTPRPQEAVYMTFGILFTVIALVALFSIVYLKSKADDAEEEVTVENAAPLVDSLGAYNGSGGTGGSIGGNTFTPNEGTTKPAYVYGSVSDPNGCTDIDHVDVKIFRTSATDQCTADNNDCYVETIPFASLTGCTGVGDLDAVYEASFALTNYIDPTDAGSPGEATDWTASSTVYDIASLSSGLYTFFEVASVNAFDIDPVTLNYGTVGLGGTSAEQTLAFENTGNRSVDAEIQADADMASDLPGYSVIPSANVRFHKTSTFDYSGVGVPVANGSSTAVTFILPQQTADLDPAPTANAYFKLVMPASGVRGVYTNTLTLTAYGL